MAREADHVTLANRNHELLKHLLEQPERFPEWIATVAFYKAVQMIEASLVKTRGHGTASHAERLLVLKQEKRYQPMYKHYRVLYSASTIARYLVDNESKHGYRSFSDYMSAKKVVHELIEHRLKSLEGALCGNQFLSAVSVKALDRL
jgi:hypothetical protein